MRDDNRHQNLTVRLDGRTLRKAKVLAAKQNTSVSKLIARYVEALVGENEAYERARKQAVLLLDQGFRLGGEIMATRESWHDRENVRMSHPGQSIAGLVVETPVAAR